MPDILIRMEMPKSCVDCHDADLPTAIAWLEAKCPCAYGMNKQGVHDLRNKRHPDCPLVELPPHGNLIDADSLADDLIYDAELAERALDDATLVGKERDYIQLEKDIKQNCAYYVSHAPVFVPAERRDADA